jgi:hypothetical protein
VTVKLKKVTFIVVLFVIVLISIGYVRADDGVRIGIGKSVINSHLKTAEIGYEWNSWEASATLTEAGKTKNGRQDQLKIYSVSYLTRIAAAPAWATPFLRLGVSYNTGSNLIGPTNFRLGVGVDFSDVWRLEYVHHSSAGIHRPNTGFDYPMITYKAPAPW